MIESIFPHIIIIFAIIGVGVAVIGVSRVFKWLSGMIYFYHTHGKPKRLQAITRLEGDSFFAICDYGGFVDPDSLSIISERLTWVEENVKGRVYLTNIGKTLSISFINESDAVAYKLRWS